MNDLVLFLAKQLASFPDEIKVESYEENGAVIIKVSAHEEDIGKLIGRGGKVANSLRTIVRSAGKKLNSNRKYILKIG